MLIVLCLGARFRLNLLSGWQARVSSTDFDTRMQVLIAGEPPALPECAEKFSVSLQAMDVLIAGSLELIENLHCCLGARAAGPHCAEHVMLRIGD